MSRRAAAAWQSDAARLAVALSCLLAVTATLGPWLHVANTAIVSATYMLVVLLVAVVLGLPLAGVAVSGLRCLTAA